MNTHTFYLTRLFRNTEETIGIFSTENRIICYSLEDEKRTIKVFNETRIPAGLYEIKFRTAGRIHEKYKKLFPDMHKGMLHIQNIPDFTYVYIHIGNNDEHTAGCPLTGMKSVIGVNNRYTLELSTYAYQKLYPLLAQPLILGDTVLLKVRDECNDIVYN